MDKQITFSKWRIASLVLLRLAIGWHFLYEGLYKLFRTGWTSKHYLLDSKGWMADTFISIANDSTALAIVDVLNVWGLILIGAGLIAGCLTRYASIAGIVLLVMFYISHIPFVGSSYMIPTEGNYLWFDRNVVEICALLVAIVFPTSHIIGVDRFFYRLKHKEGAKS